MFIIVIKEGCERCKVLINHLRFNKIQFICIRSNEMPPDVIDELKILDDFPIILHQKDFKGDLAKKLSFFRIK